MNNTDSSPSTISSTPKLLAASKIEATGRALPQRIVSNSEIENRCGLEPGWIEQRTGIRERPVAKPEESVSDFALEAGNAALSEWESHGDTRTKIGMLILATSTPDHLLPPTAPLVAHQLELGNIPAFDMAVACSGFLYALKVADGFCRTSQKPVLVIAANVLTKRVSESDPATAALFADGAGAAVIAPAKEAGLLSIALQSDGSGYDCLKIPHGGSVHPFDETTLSSDSHKMKVANGMAVFRYAVESMTQLGQQVMKENQVAPAAIDFWIPHQANARIIESVRQRLELPNEKTAMTIGKFANSSAATIPIALDYYRECNQIKSGDLLLFTAAAAGLTSGAALLRL